MMRGTLRASIGATALLAATYSALPSTSIAQAASVRVAPKLSLISDALKLHISAGQITGGIVLIMHAGQVVHYEAQGTVDGKPLRPDAIFGIASLSKPVTAVAIMMLVDEGKIGLDDPVSKYIPEFGAPRTVRVLRPGSPPPPFSPLPGLTPETSFGDPQYEMVAAERAITVRMLLSHTSGIQIFGVGNPGFPRATPGDTLADRIPKLASALLEYQPGSRWAYSNGPGIEVLGRIVEVASAQPLDKFLQARLFTPLGMTETGFGVPRNKLGRASPMIPGAPVPVREETTYFSGSAGLWSTISDYSKFAQMLTDNGKFAGRQLLQPETVKAMASNQIGALTIDGYPPIGMPTQGLKFGLGMLTVVDPVASGTQVPAGSFGWDGIGTRRFWAIPDKQLTIVTMVPAIGPAAAPLQRDVESIAVGAFR